jgi:(2R)-3-sulfolactate dehydrogenase (NADP+)
MESMGMSDAVMMSVDNLRELVADVFVAARTSPKNAEAVAEALVQAEIDGQKGHGLSRIESYSAQSRTGKVDGFATPTLRAPRPGGLMIDACHGFAYPAVNLAIDALPEAARATGIAAAGITRSHHCGAMGRHVERLADAGLVAVVFANTPDAMAPWGGTKRLYGTNPIAFAAPQRDAPPAVVDLALSQVARGKILTAAQKDEAIPEGWATDEHGQPTTDAKTALAGTLVPIGGPKGAALAFMVELLAVALTGSNFAYEATSFFDGEGEPPGVGQFLIAIDPGAFAGEDVFLDRMAGLCGLISDDPGARLPGSRRMALRETALRDGVPVAADLVVKIDQLRNDRA